jgi:predicted DCC family thiol-disulfide oxidoreductase YuxK
MTNESRFRVSNPPAKPLLIWDGECHFCRRWIERWREITLGQIEFTTYQETAGKFPEIPHAQFQRALAFVDDKGRVFFAAEAVYQSLQHRSYRRWLSWSYNYLPGFATASEFAYRFIAGHRQLGSAITRLLWGVDVRVPKYFWARKWFLRALGLVYLIAFVSFWVQIDGLVGSNGILPIRQFLSAAHQELGTRALWILPTFCWLNTSDVFLNFLCGGGVALSILLIAGIAPAICLLILFAFYLSLTIAGQVFLSFQWDILLLETGFLSIFLAPWRWHRHLAGAISAGSQCHDPGAEPLLPRAGLFLLKFLLFKLVLMSGMVKLTSGDDCWWNLTALDYHYWSQPLPTIFAWYADKSPEWFKHFSVAFCLVVEIVVPCFIWAPRRLRLIACGLLIFLQIVIAITGNYCFFNLLTIALCLLLIDDAVVGPARSPSRSLRAGGRAVRFGAPGLPPPCPPEGRTHPVARMGSAMASGRALPLSNYASVAVIIFTLPLNVWLIFDAFRPEARMPGIIRSVYERIEPFRIVNGYGLFRVMTKDRGEIIVEGSADGIDWRAYEFEWKPGDVMRAPRWCAPHQPRLDWQMWFAALGSYRQNPWFVRLLICLLRGEPEVTQLFAHNPFPRTPPRYVRAIFYRYRFTTSEEHGQTGAWWTRQELGEYLPSISLEDVR